LSDVVVPFVGLVVVAVNVIAPALVQAGTDEPVVANPNAVICEEPETTPFVAFIVPLKDVADTLPVTFNEPLIFKLPLKRVLPTTVNVGIEKVLIARTYISPLLPRVS
jgi:hypothetical protein